MVPGDEGGVIDPNRPPEGMAAATAQNEADAEAALARGAEAKTAGEGLQTEGGGPSPVAGGDDPPASPEFDTLCEAANDAARAITRGEGDRSVTPWTHMRPDQKGAARQLMRLFMDDPEHEPGTDTTGRVYHAIANAFRNR